MLKDKGRHLFMKYLNRYSKIYITKVYSLINQIVDIKVINDLNTKCSAFTSFIHGHNLRIVQRP